MNRAKVKEIADDLLRKHGLADRGWTFVFDTNTKRRLGCCRYASKQISLTGWYVDKNEMGPIYDTLLHEVAHALTPGAGHGPVWKGMCAQLGCKPSACKQSHEFVTRPSRYVAACSVCSKTFYREKVDRHKTYSCTCQNHIAEWADRVKLVFLINQQRARDVAEFIQATPMDSEIKTLVHRLGSTTNRYEAKQIRGRLRSLGHRGGLNG